jgi:hypothetical protein
MLNKKLLNLLSLILILTALITPMNVNQSQLLDLFDGVVKLNASGGNTNPTINCNTNGPYVNQTAYPTVTNLVLNTPVDTDINIPNAQIYANTSPSTAIFQDLCFQTVPTLGEILYGEGSVIYADGQFKSFISTKTYVPPTGFVGTECFDLYAEGLSNVDSSYLNTNVFTIEIRVGGSTAGCPGSTPPGNSNNLTLSPASVGVQTSQDIELGSTLLNSIPTGGVIQVVYPTASYTGTPTLTVSSSIGSTTVTTSGDNTIITGTLINSIPAGSTLITVSGLTTSATPSVNPFTLYTSTGDFGSAFQYVGGANEVIITGIVPVSLSFVIRNADDTANTNICDMGNLSITTIGTCSYRLKVRTNAQNGYTINKTSEGGFTNGSYTFTNAAVGATGTAQTAGTELYGAKIDKGAVTTPGATVTLAPDYDAGATNNVDYSGTSPEALVNSSKPNNPTAIDTVNTSLVTHEAGIQASTPAGIYTQKVIYTVVPVFQANVGG